MKVTKLTKFSMILIVMFLFGYGRCIYKFVKCDFDPINKAEIIYGIGLFTGTGGIIGWFDIEDKNKNNIKS